MCVRVDVDRFRHGREQTRVRPGAKRWWGESCLLEAIGSILVVERASSLSGGGAPSCNTRYRRHASNLGQGNQTCNDGRWCTRPVPNCFRCRSFRSLLAILNAHILAHILRRGRACLLFSLSSECCDYKTILYFSYSICLVIFFGQLLFRPSASSGWWRNTADFTLAAHTRCLGNTGRGENFERCHHRLRLPSGGGVSGALGWLGRYGHPHARTICRCAHFGRPRRRRRIKKGEFFSLSFLYSSCFILYFNVRWKSVHNWSKTCLAVESIEA